MLSCLAITRPDLIGLVPRHRRGVGGVAASALLHRARLCISDVEDDGLIVRLADALDGAVADLVIGKVVQLEERADGDEHGRGLDADGAGLLVGGLAELEGVLLIAEQAWRRPTWQIR